MEELFTQIIAFNGRADEGVISNHDVVMNAFKNQHRYKSFKK